jgi:hypothetical protein
MSQLSRKDIGRLIIGLCAVPILSTWAMVSFLPIAGLLGPAKPLIFAVADVLFLLTGFGALLAPLVAAVLFARPQAQGTVKTALKGRLGVITLYASVWLALYWAVSLATY